MGGRLVSKSPVEVAAVNRLVLLCADEALVNDEPLSILLVARYHLNLHTLQVLVWVDEVLLVIPLLVPPLLPLLSSPQVIVTTRAMRQKQRKSIALFAVLSMD